ncbi:MAG: twin-arginine translocase TatA/TatE family subunit [Terracidiphilus sp.]
MMANLGMADTLLLMVLALVVFGPRRLPQIGRQIGKLMYEFRKASNDFKFQMEEELRQAEEADRRKKEEEERQRALAAAPPAPQLEAPAASAVDSTAPTPETPAESPYPGENTYPDLAADATRPEEVQPEATQPEDLTASAVEAARLRIQPPSTGAVVAANPPGQPAQQAELFELSAEPVAESTAAPTPEDAATTPASDNPVAERSEPAAHHG